ncbi:DsrE family protein [Thiomicrospira sp. R3]|uniref:DsrE family protein n=1 Tax=Thiomicrospira sp. R3 TaxID=3035472 RepID=UPI00259BE107|nr:DsrE family protein [Thiomicrospira sp. R3]WFE69350.1 DsrE family protein [Thiomicrospira sp. R3]
MRIFQIWLISLAVFLGLGHSAHAQTLKPVKEIQGASQDRFPGDPASHKVVYMFNQADNDYQTSILNSIQAMLRVYEDDVEIAVVVIGPGIHVLANKPQREVDSLIYDRVESFALDYNVRWIACGSTMNTLGWQHEDIRPFAEYVEVGASALMELQSNGFAFIAW